MNTQQNAANGHNKVGQEDMMQQQQHFASTSSTGAVSRAAKLQAADSLQGSSVNSRMRGYIPANGHPLGVVGTNGNISM